MTTTSTTKDLRNKTRPTLLKKVKDPTNTEAWWDFYRIYCPLVTAEVRRRRLPEAKVDDLIQEIFIKIVEAMKTFEYQAGRRPGSFRAWLRKRVSWRVLSEQIKPNREVPFQSEGSQDTSNEEILEDLLESPEGIPLGSNLDLETYKDLYQRAVSKVHKGKQWQIYDLLVHQDRSVAEVCTLFQTDAQSVYVAKCKVEASIKQQLKDIVAALPPLD